MEPICSSETSFDQTTWPYNPRSYDAEFILFQYLFVIMYFFVGGITKIIYYYNKLAYFPGVARVYIYPNLIVICVPSLAEIAHLYGILNNNFYAPWRYITHTSADLHTVKFSH
jgi:hypothetical protein